MFAESVIYDAVIKTPVKGMRLGIKTQGDSLAMIDFLLSDIRVRRPATDIVCETVSQLEAYFENPHWQFSLPLLKQGTPFQQQVWQQMTMIPVGETRSYGEVAKRLKSAPRAVGGACRRNPVPLVVPCHRIVAANGIGGFSGETKGPRLAFKQWLLAHEQQ